METMRDPVKTPQLSPDQYHLVLDSLSEGVCTVDNQWNITSFNLSAQKMTGISAAAALGVSFGEFFQCEFHECKKILSGIMTSGESVRDVSTRLSDQNGHFIPVMLNATPLRGTSGEIVGLVATFRDNRNIEALRRELHDKFIFADIVSKNARLRRILDMVPIVAESGSSVLILGPSGTGKELLARAIHLNSPRKDKPFVAVNCGALPDNLLESELFGYKKGAFTDARTDKLGRFALADGGTLFLDEIGDTSPAMQVKLLRVLQEKQFEPLGSTHPVPCDVRLISATNSDLNKRLAEGSFRTDLFYRINVITFELPPLSERTEDIPLLVEHFIASLNAEKGRTIRGISQGAMSRLMSYHYSGNIRELRNIVEHAYVMCRCDELQEQCLPAHVLTATEHPQPKPQPTDPKTGDYALAENRQKPRFLNLRTLSKQDERKVIEETLQEVGGHRADAAARLGINPSTLWRKMKKHDLQ